MKIRNRQKSEKEWSEIAKRCELSSLPIEQFCLEEGISLTAYYKNRKKLALNKEVKFIEVAVDNKNAPPRRLLLELRFSNWELIFNVGGI